MKFSGKKSLSAKYKVYIAALLWVVLCAAMFMKVFGILDASNSQVATDIGAQKTALGLLQDERDSYIKAQGDITKMAGLPLQPDAFFSKDVTLVREIETLENWATELNVKLTLSGLSGTIETAQKAKTITPVFALPYNIGLNGTLSQVVKYMQAVEHLSFVTTVSGVTINSAEGDTVDAAMPAIMYLKQ